MLVGWVVSRETSKRVFAKDLTTFSHRICLTLFPDKNKGNEEEAEEKFKEIKTAYEVLFDEQERAW